MCKCSIFFQNEFPLQPQCKEVLTVCFGIAGRARSVELGSLGIFPTWERIKQPANKGSKWKILSAKQANSECERGKMGSVFQNQTYLHHGVDRQMSKCEKLAVFQSQTFSSHLLCQKDTVREYSKPTR